MTLERISRVSRSSIPMHGSLANEYISTALLPRIACSLTLRSAVQFLAVWPDETFVAFYCSASTAELFHGVVLHGFTDTVKHEPCRLLGDLESSAAISALLTPFLQLTTIQNAVIHLSMPRGESSKMVPTLTLNCFLHPLQNHIKRVRRIECWSQPQRGHVILLSRPAKVDRIDESALRISEVCDCFLQGTGLFDVRHFFALTIHLDAAYTKRICESSIYLP